MPNFRRYYLPDAIVFITAVLRDRRPLFADEANVLLLFDTMRAVQKVHGFHLLAYVILPDHLHWLMQTEPTTNFSIVMKSIKWNYTRNYKVAQGIRDQCVLWQSRFWDHVIRDEADLARHMDYIHYNPVKHGHVSAPTAWPHSTLDHWTRLGYYPADWGSELADDARRMELE